MSKLNALVIVFATSCSVFARASATKTEAAAPHAAPMLDRSAWAYPEGLILTEIAFPKLSDDDIDLARSLRKFSERLRRELRQCFGRARDKNQSLTKGNIRFSPKLRLVINAYGEATSAELTLPDHFVSLAPCKKSGEALAKDWNYSTPTDLEAQEADPAPKKGAKKKPKKPVPENKINTFELGYDVVFLDDDQARGRGFLYKEAEEAFEKALLSEELFACTKDSDCKLVQGRCGSWSVNRSQAAQFQKVLQARKRKACEPKTSDKNLEPKEGAAHCVKGRCQS